MENLAKALTSAINSGNLPRCIEEKAKSLLKDLADMSYKFVKDPNKWDDVKIRALRVDMAYNFATGRYFPVRKKLGFYEWEYKYETNCYVSRLCEGCKFYQCVVKTKSGYIDSQTREYCTNPFNKCPRQFGRFDKASNALLRWLIIHEDILEDATKEYQNQLLYIAQNPSKRYTGICHALYESIQIELVRKLMNYKIYTTLCNQLTPNHC